MQCKAKTRQGVRCKNTVTPGKQVCRLHGGLTPGGTASPHFKHGRYSKYLPANLLGKYETARSDPDLLSLRSEVSVISARIMEQLEGLDAGNTAENWLRLSQDWQNMIRAQQAGDSDRANELAAEINSLIAAGAEEVDTWKEIDRLIEIRRRLVQTESKRELDLEIMISAERATALIYVILDIIKSNILGYKQKQLIADDKLLSAIATDVRKIIASDDSR